MKNIQLITALLFLSSFTFAQNLLPNPSFESKWSCPSSEADIQLTKYWLSPENHGGTPDYYHSCATSTHVMVPFNVRGNEIAHSGEAYVGISIYEEASNYREYLQVELKDALKAGVTYELSLFYSLGDASKWAVNSLGFHFSEANVLGDGTDGPLSVTPQLVVPDFLNEANGWAKIEFDYVATGKEKFLTIGSFVKNSEVNPIEVNAGGMEESYVFLDDIVVIESPCDFEIDLGEDKTVCREEELILDASLEGASYVWMDGSTEPQIEVKKEGIYGVTVKKGQCERYDEIEIKFFEQPDLKLTGDTVLCEDDRIEFEYGGLEVDFACNNVCTDEGKIIEVNGRYFVSVEYSCGNYKEPIDVNFVDCSCQLFVPNTFTPNLDKINGEFKPISHCPLTSYSMVVYNRWGELIFESHSYDLFWTGHDDRKEVPEGRYEYLVKYQFEDMDYPVEQYGSVYLKR